MECCARTLEDARHVETGVAGRVAGGSSESALALRRLRGDGGGRGEAVGAGGCRAGKFDQLEQLDLLAATAQMLLED